MKRILLTLAAFLTAFTMFGQGKYGADSAECIKYLSFYKQYVKEGNHEDAARNWRQAIKYCPPTASQNMLLDGMKVMRRDIMTYKNNPVRRKELIDTLMMLHQMRIDTYPRYVVRAKVNKATDMINYAESGKEMEVYEAVWDAMNVAKEKSPVSIIVRYMQLASDLYKDGRLVEDDVLRAFEASTNLLEKMNEKKPSEMYENAIGDVESVFAQSGVANCERLISVFGPRYEENPGDEAILSNIVKLFSATECTESELFRKAVEGLYKIDPSHESAYLLYKLYSNVSDQYSQAVKYMEEAINYEESDNETDAKYYYELATFYYKNLGDNASAVKAAKQAAQLSDSYAATAYLLIGTIWGSTKCTGNEIEIRAPFWVATDYLLKAKKLDSSLADEVNKKIAEYSKYYPMQSEAFMYDVVDGDSYTVSCGGMRETTIVRTQK